MTIPFLWNCGIRLAHNTIPPQWLMGLHMPYELLYFRRMVIQTHFLAVSETFHGLASQNALVITLCIIGLNFLFLKDHTAHQLVLLSYGCWLGKCTCHVHYKSLSVHSCSWHFLCFSAFSCSNLDKKLFHQFPKITTNSLMKIKPKDMLLLTEQLWTCRFYFKISF